MIFFGCWMVGIYCSWLKIYYYSFVDLKFAFLYFLFNAFFFLFPLFCYLCLIKKQEYMHTLTIDYDCVFFRRNINKGLLIICILLLFNFYKHGYPPLLSLFGYTTKNYVEYGSLKQVIFALLTVIMLSCALTSSYFKMILTAFVFIIFMSRGPLLTSLACVLFFLLLTGKLKFKTILIIFIVLMLGNAWLGDLRTNKELFLQYMNILPEKSNWNTSILWLVSYIATPFSNMLWIAQNELKIGWGESLITFLPGSIRNQFFDNTVHYPAYIIDGVHGYLSPIFNDYGFVGVALFNMLLGFIFCYIHKKKMFLLYSFFLGMLCFIFFFNPFVQLTTIISLFLIVFISKGIKRVYISL